jgi:hypothetical protein
MITARTWKEQKEKERVVKEKKENEKSILGVFRV